LRSFLPNAGLAKDALLGDDETDGKSGSKLPHSK